MRFSTVIVSLVAAAGFVAAQSSSVTSSAPIPTNSSSYDKATVACLEGCNINDVNCQASCLGNPHPDEAAVNATTQCAMKCVQGDGTVEQTKIYADCQQKCITDLFLTTTGAPAKATGGSSTKDGAKDSASGDDKKDGESTDTKKDDSKSAAGKLAVSAGGAIALALVALAL